MFDVPTKEDWKQLFKAANSIKETKPWTVYPEEIIFSIPGGYISIHGFEEESKGLTFYRSDSELSNYLRILNAEEWNATDTILRYGSGLSLWFGPVSYLSPGDFTAMKEAEFNPDDSNEGHVFFRSQIPGKCAWYIDREQVIALTKAVNTFNSLLDTKPSFTQKEQYDLVYILGEDSLNPKQIPFPHELLPDTANVIKDDFYVHSLRKLKHNGRTLELDRQYLTRPVESQLDGIPYYPEILVIADTTEGVIADQCMIDEDTDSDEAMYAFLKEYFTKEGLPYKITLRTGHLTPYLKDLFKKLNITLEEKTELPLTDDFLAVLV